MRAHRLYSAYCRIYQTVYRLAAFALHWPKPEVIRGADSPSRLAQRLKALHISRALLVTGPHILSMGLDKPLRDALATQGIAVEVFSDTPADPSIDDVEAALGRYRDADCQALIALGGGSPMDCAKGVSARVARPRKPLIRMRGPLKVRRKTPVLAAIPTTAGTGSEMTPVAVLTHPERRMKFIIIDPVLIPRIVLLIPEITRSLPPHTTAATGMDALTHAVEAYAGRSNTARTRRDALEAVRLVFAHLRRAYAHGEELEARSGLLRASHLAGRAFARAYVGYVHAISHAVGSRYHIPHGLANAVVLPYVLDAYGVSAHRPLADLAAAAGIGTPRMSDAERARAFIAGIRSLNRALGIPTYLPELCGEDIPELIASALREANPLYPVPRIFDAEDMASVFALLLPPAPPQ